MYAQTDSHFSIIEKFKLCVIRVFSRKAVQLQKFILRFISSCLNLLRGPYTQKMILIKKILLMKYQHVADIVVEFYSCATYV